MYARVSTLQGQAGDDAVETATAVARDQVLPSVQQMQGFKGMMALGDRQTGKVMSVTLWETEDDLRASEEAANRLRASAADQSSTQIVDVDRFEVTLSSMM
jgi:heme-degrading monooxygenase HmoA